MLHNNTHQHSFKSHFSATLVSFLTFSHLPFTATNAISVFSLIYLQFLLPLLAGRILALISAEFQLLLDLPNDFSIHSRQFSHHFLDLRDTVLQFISAFFARLYHEQ